MEKHVEGWGYTKTLSTERWMKMLNRVTMLVVDHNLGCRHPCWEYMTANVSTGKRTNWQPLVNKHARTYKQRLEYALAINRLEN